MEATPQPSILTSSYNGENLRRGEVIGVVTLKQTPDEVASKKRKKSSKRRHQAEDMSSDLSARKKLKKNHQFDVKCENGYRNMDLPEISPQCAQPEPTDSYSYYSPSSNYIARLLEDSLEVSASEEADLTVTKPIKAKKKKKEKKKKDKSARRMQESLEIKKEIDHHDNTEKNMDLPVVSLQCAQPEPSDPNPHLSLSSSHFSGLLGTISVVEESLEVSESEKADLSVTKPKKHKKKKEKKKKDKSARWMQESLEIKKEIDHHDNTEKNMDSPMLSLQCAQPEPTDPNPHLSLSSGNLSGLLGSISVPEESLEVSESEKADLSVTKPKKAKKKKEKKKRDKSARWMQESLEIKKEIDHHDNTEKNMDLPTLSLQCAQSEPTDPNTHLLQSSGDLSGLLGSISVPEESLEVSESEEADLSVTKPKKHKKKKEKKKDKSARRKHENIETEDEIDLHDNTERNMDSPTLSLQCAQPEPTDPNPRLLPSSGNLSGLLGSVSVPEESLEVSESETADLSVTKPKKHKKKKEKKKKVKSTRKKQENIATEDEIDHHDNTERGSETPSLPCGPAEPVGTESGMSDASMSDRDHSYSDDRFYSAGSVCSDQGEPAAGPHNVSLPLDVSAPQDETILEDVTEAVLNERSPEYDAGLSHYEDYREMPSFLPTTGMGKRGRKPLLCLETLVEQAIASDDPLKSLNSHGIASTSWWSKVTKLFKEKGVSLKFTTGKYSQEERNILRDNIDTFREEHRLSITKVKELVGIGVKDLSLKDKKELQLYGTSKFKTHLAKNLDRPLSSVYFHTRETLVKSTSGEFEDDELAAIQELVSKYGPKWTSIAQELDRTPTSIRNKMATLTTPKDRIKGKWTEEEEYLLKKYITRYSGLEDVTMVPNNPIPWTDVAEKVSTRTAVQCRQHWLQLYQNGRRVNTHKRIELEEKRQLVSLLEEQNMDLQTDVDWSAIVNAMGNQYNVQKLKNMWYNLKTVLAYHPSAPFKEVIASVKNYLNR